MIFVLKNVDNETKLKVYYWQSTKNPTQHQLSSPFIDISMSEESVRYFHEPALELHNEINSNHSFEQVNKNKHE